MLNNEIFIETVREEGTGQTDTIFQCPTIPDQIIRGNLQIVKFREDKEEESEQGEQKSTFLRELFYNHIKNNRLAV